MGEHQKYKYSITILTGDLAVVNCLRALSQYSQKTGNNRITWGNTKGHKLGRFSLVDKGSEGWQI
jgi:hypothetical protein